MGGWGADSWSLGSNVALRLLAPRLAQSAPCMASHTLHPLPGEGHPPKHRHTCLPSLRQTPLTVFVGAMVTTGGVLGTLCPPGGTMMGPMGPRLGVLAGELWLVAGEETGDDSLLIEDP